jgi:sulfane dehydrogenase subunit SoxC
MSSKKDITGEKDGTAKPKQSSRRRFLTQGAALAGLATVGALRAARAQDWRSKLPPLPDPNDRTEFVPEDKVPMDHVLRDPWTGEPMRDEAGELIVDWTGTPQWEAYNKNIRAAAGPKYGKTKDNRLYGQPSRFQTTYRRGFDGAAFSWGVGTGSGRPIQPTTAKAESASLEAVLDAQLGIITPNGLHFVDEHGEVPEIDPRQHRLTIHGMVDRPLTFTVDDLMRLSSVSRVHFIDCNSNGTTSMAARLAPWATAGHCFPEGSCAEWTGVLLSTLLEATGVKKGAKWFYASGADEYNQSWAIPMWKALDDAIVAYGQNGEFVRPENGFPIRLVLPGFQGTMMMKRLRSIKVADELAQFHREYRDQFPDDKITWYRFEHPPKSCILRPSGGMTVPKGGFYEIRGVAWSGSGKITKVEVTVDGGKTWKPAQIQSPVFSKAHTRFVFPWSWNGEEMIIAARCTDERGATQPTTAQLAKAKGRELDVDNAVGLNNYNRFNAPQPWKIDREGKVTNAIFAI